MSEGWIKLHRKIAGWEWYQDGNTTRLFLHLIIFANHKDGRYQGHQVKRGQIISGRKSLASKLGLTEQQIRTSLDKLELSLEITSKPTNKYTLYTIINYNTYNNNKEESNQQDNKQTTITATNKQPANQPTDNHKQECIEEKKKDAPSFSNDSWELKTAKGMFKIMQQNNPRHTKEPNYQKWAKELDGLHRIDKIKDKIEIENVLVWSLDDTFWSKQIQSPANFRKHYPRLWQNSMDAANGQGWENK